MASQAERQVPQPGGKDKRRSLLPAPKSKLPSPGAVKSSPTTPEVSQDNSDSPPVFPTAKAPSLKSPTAAEALFLQLGYRVAIAGVKVGVLRYYGKVHFAQGIWCGIELDEPEGKHDGVVDDTRYFQCADYCGIFAPSHKVDFIGAPTSKSKPKHKHHKEHRSHPRDTSPEVADQLHLSKLKIRKSDIEKSLVILPKVQETSPSEVTSKLTIKSQTVVTQKSGLPQIKQKSPESGLLDSAKLQAVSGSVEDKRPSQSKQSRLVKPKGIPRPKSQIVAPAQKSPLQSSQNQGESDITTPPSCENTIQTSPSELNNNRNDATMSKTVTKTKPTTLPQDLNQNLNGTFTLEDKDDAPCAEFEELVSPTKAAQNRQLTLTYVGDSGDDLDDPKEPHSETTEPHFESNLDKSPTDSLLPRRQVDKTANNLNATFDKDCVIGKDALMETSHTEGEMAESDIESANIDVTSDDVLQNGVEAKGNETYCDENVTDSQDMDKVMDYTQHAEDKVSGMDQAMNTTYESNQKQFEPLVEHEHNVVTNSHQSIVLDAEHKEAGLGNGTIESESDATGAETRTRNETSDSSLLECLQSSHLMSEISRLGIMPPDELERTRFLLEGEMENDSHDVISPNELMMPDHLLDGELEEIEQQNGLVYEDQFIHDDQANYEDHITKREDYHIISDDFADDEEPIPADDLDGTFDIVTSTPAVHKHKQLQESYQRMENSPISMESSIELIGTSSIHGIKEFNETFEIKKENITYVQDKDLDHDTPHGVDHDTPDLDAMHDTSAPICAIGKETIQMDTTTTVMNTTNILIEKQQNVTIDLKNDGLCKELEEIELLHSKNESLIGDSEQESTDSTLNTIEANLQEPGAMTIDNTDLITTTTEEGDHVAMTSKDGDQVAMPTDKDEGISTSMISESDEKNVFSEQGPVLNKDRPISIISTTSTDTGYQPDTDSEVGTLNIASPSEWQGRQGNKKHVDGTDTDKQLHDDTQGQPSVIECYVASFQQADEDGENGSVCVDQKGSESEDDTTIAMDSEMEKMDHMEGIPPIPSDELTLPNLTDDVVEVPTNENLDDCKDDLPVEPEENPGKDDMNQSKDGICDIEVKGHDDTDEVRGLDVTEVKGQDDIEVKCQDDTEVKEQDDLGAKEQNPENMKEAKDKKPEKNVKTLSKGLANTPRKLPITKSSETTKSKLGDTPKNKVSDISKTEPKKIGSNVKPKIGGLTKPGTSSLLSKAPSKQTKTPSTLRQPISAAPSKTPDNKSKTSAVSKIETRRSMTGLKDLNKKHLNDSKKDTPKKPLEKIVPKTNTELKTPRLKTNVKPKTDTIPKVEKTPRSNSKQSDKTPRSSLPKPPLNDSKSKVTTPRKSTTLADRTKMAGKTGKVANKKSSAQKENEKEAGMLEVQIDIVDDDKLNISKGKTGSVHSSRSDISALTEDTNRPGSRTGSRSRLDKQTDSGRMSLSKRVSTSSTRLRKTPSNSSLHSDISQDSDISTASLPCPSLISAIPTFKLPCIPPSIEQSKNERNLAGTKTAMLKRRSMIEPPKSSTLLKKEKETRRTSLATPMNRTGSKTKKADEKTEKPTSTPTTPKRTIAGKDLSKAKTSKSTTTPRKTPQEQQLETITNSLAKATEEVTRLEGVCEERTKEIANIRMLLKDCTLGMDAFGVMANYLTHELDAFSCPVVKSKLQETKLELEEAHQAIDTIAAEKRELREEITKVKEAHVSQVTTLQQEHKQALHSLEERLKLEKEQELEKVIEQHSLEVKTLKQYHERNVHTLSADHDKAVEDLHKQHAADIENMKHKQEEQIAELQTLHECKLRDITNRFEDIKVSLLEKVEVLRIDCDQSRARVLECQEAFERDSDAKIKVALAPYKHLPQEIESLKAVLDMRNQEIHNLRSKQMELEKKSEELLLEQEKVRNLKQKNENLEAILNIRQENEKQLSDKHQVLLRKYDREAKEKKRLSMNNEELMWRLETSSSPTGSECGSPDIIRRDKTLSPNPNRSSRPISGDFSGMAVPPRSPTQKIMRSNTFVLGECESKKKNPNNNNGT